MEKELIILVHYVHIGNQSPQKAKEFLCKCSDMLKRETVNDLQYRFKHFIYPVREEENAKIECIFPKEYDSNVETILRDLDIKYEQLLSISL